MKVKEIGTDIGLFVDWAVFLAEDRVVALNRCNHESRSFATLSEAVEYASRRSNTLSPRYPKNYRSSLVRHLEGLGVNNRDRLLELFRGGVEDVVMDEKSHPVLDPERIVPPAELYQRQGRKYLRFALEADTREEERGWLERANEMFNQLKREDIRNAQRADTDTSEGDGRVSSEPWRHVSGRGYSTAWD